MSKHLHPKIELIEEIKQPELKDIEKGVVPPSPKTKNFIENEWSAGCLGKIDRRCIVYFSQMILLSTVIGVSLFQVSTTSENQTFWTGTLCSCIGILLPQPKMRKSD